MRRPRSISYSPLTRHFRELFATHAEAERRKMPVDEVAGERQERLLTRRKLLAEATAASAVLAGVSLKPARAATSARIAIVGAGLAGLRCAHMLWTGGSRIPSTVYEADTTHIGGRCWSLRGYFQNGLVGEHGGAFINHDETAIRSLSKNLGLKEEVVSGGDLPSGEEIFWFDGKPYTYDDANADWGAIGYPVFQSAYKKAPWPQRYNSSTAEGRRLDQVTIPDWLDQTGIGSNTRFGRLMLANSVSVGMGQSAKIHVQVQRKTWPALGYSGVSYTDWNAYCVAWDDSVPLGTSGPAILLGFPGGSTGQNVLTGAAHGKAPTKDVNWFLNQIEPVFPGTKAAYSGLAYEDHWSADPWHQGAYSYWRLGQYTGFSGYEGVQAGNVHFAGEHTDPEEQGFLNGAVSSGERAACEIMHQV